jgi:hypothetical protein
MTHKHTPGPWATDGNGLITAGKNRLHIAQTAVTGMGSAAEANANLLAAAPEMLDTLKLALLVLERRMNAQGIDHTDDTEAQILRAVIRKATTGA